MDHETRKQRGAYYTPDKVVRSLVRWAVRRPSDRTLDPSCGDGRFLACHANSVGVEQAPEAATLARGRAPGHTVWKSDLFRWATETDERFDCAAENPPFIRYQRFSGDVRRRALALCARHGARFSSLTSSWAPFLVATATLLRPGGRMAFVVPAELGHATYAKPVLRFMADHFDHVQIVAVEEKLFPDLSEDYWLLYGAGYGGQTDAFWLATQKHFRFTPSPPRKGTYVSREAWERWGERLRPFLLPEAVRGVYRAAAEADGSRTLGNVATVRIGYVTGANEFFHLRPSEAGHWRIPKRFLRPAARNARSLPAKAITKATVGAWRQQDDRFLLLHLTRQDQVPEPVRRYLASPEAEAARQAYKGRTRSPWYAVPDVTVPDAFLSYMSGAGPTLVANRAGCVATNSVHVITLTDGMSVKDLQTQWQSPLTRFRCEVEGHPLGGGMLKIEPREAARVVVTPPWKTSPEEAHLLREGIAIMRAWRHYG